jgi:hypothetical protein
MKTQTPALEKTPQAVDDFLEAANPVNSNTAVVIGTVNGLLANDNGSKKGFWLVGADEYGILTLAEGTIEISANGSILFTATEEFDGGEIFFDYQIQMGNSGVLSTATATFDINQILIDFEEPDVGGAFSRVDPLTQNGFTFTSPGNILIGDQDYSNFNTSVTPPFAVSQPPGNQFGVTNFFSSDPDLIVNYKGGEAFKFVSGFFCTIGQQSQIPTKDITLEGYRNGILVESLTYTPDATLFVQTGWNSKIDQLVVKDNNSLASLAFDDLTFALV